MVPAITSNNDAERSADRKRQIVGEDRDHVFTELLKQTDCCAMTYDELTKRQR